MPTYLLVDIETSGIPIGYVDIVSRIQRPGQNLSSIEVSFAVAGKLPTKWLPVTPIRLLDLF